MTQFPNIQRKTPKDNSSAIKNSQDKLPTSDEIIKHSQESKNSLILKTPTRLAVKRHYDKISRHSAENTKGQFERDPNSEDKLATDEWNGRQSEAVTRDKPQILVLEGQLALARRNLNHIH